MLNSSLPYQNPLPVTVALTLTLTWSMPASKPGWKPKLSRTGGILQLTKIVNFCFLLLIVAAYYWSNSKPKKFSIGSLLVR